jgi:hypothetical protein
VGSGQRAVVSGQHLIVWVKCPITSQTFMTAWLAGSSILKARIFFIGVTLPGSITQTMSKRSGPVNLLTHGGGGHWSLGMGH